MGLIGGIARVAAVSATATATSNAVNRRMAKKNVEAYGTAQTEVAQEQGYAPPMTASAGISPTTVVDAAPAAAPAPAGGGEDDKLAQLEKLGKLHSDGILTDEEFAAQKAQILGQ